MGDFDENPDRFIKCETFSLTDTPSLNSNFGYDQLNETYLVPQKTFEILKFRPNAHVSLLKEFRTKFKKMTVISKLIKKYEGTEIVNGIMCDKYTGCRISSKSNSSTKSIHYFTSISFNIKMAENYFGY